jgi:hypothetical protein
MHKLNHNSFSYNKRYPGVSSVSLFL